MKNKWEMKVPRRKYVAPATGKKHHKLFFFFNLNAANRINLSLLINYFTESDMFWLAVKLHSLICDVALSRIYKGRSFPLGFDQFFPIHHRFYVIATMMLCRINWLKCATFLQTIESDNKAICLNQLINLK